MIRFTAFILSLTISTYAMADEAGKANKASPTENKTDTQESTEIGKSGPPLKFVGIGMIGVGSAVAIAGAITGGLALKREQQLADNCPDRDRCPISNRSIENRARTLAATTDVLLPIGGVLVASGVVLFVIGKKKSRASDESLSLKAYPSLNEQNAGFVISGRF